MPVDLLRRLSGVRRREATGPRAEDIGIQREHDEERSREISRFVRAGYPWATLKTAQQERFPTLRKPGWLPTAVVANLVGPMTERNGITAAETDLIRVAPQGDDLAYLVLPEGVEEASWRPNEGRLEPIEIIDGQHRLYALLDDQELDGNFDLPVVLFEDLDISWQAYLFWTINITPKRISPSLAYDLYPLLRTTAWLEVVEGPMAYRETRAQELTEALWSHPKSAWRDRIGMLGRERGKVTQAAFVRSLTLSFVRGWAGSRKTGIGGFFGTEQSEERTDVLQWNRAQQAAYLMELWSSLAESIASSSEKWAQDLRHRTPQEDVPAGGDSAFAGRYSLLAADQGVRGFLQVCNDISYERRNNVLFREWRRPTPAGATDIDKVTAALEDLRHQSRISAFIHTLTTDISTFDWRSAATPGLSEDVEDRQSRYRGGSGYKQVRLQLLRHLGGSGTPEIAASARTVARALGYDHG